MTDPYVGRLAYFRVYSGVLRAGENIYNSTKGERERIGRLLRMHANQREEVEDVYAGGIAAAVGLKKTFTGDTLCAQDAQVILENITFPEPVISVALEPKSKDDQDKMGESLMKLAEEDPTFRWHFDDETGQTLIAGMGELHLEIIVDRMFREHKVDANVGRPQVAYREAIPCREADAEGRFVRQSGGRGQFGHACHQHVSAASRAPATSSRTRSSAAPSRTNTSTRSSRASRSAAGRRPRRLPGARREGRPRRRFVPRRRLVGNGVQERRLDGHSRKAS